MGLFICMRYKIPLLLSNMLDETYIINITSKIDKKFLPKVQIVASDLNKIALLEPRIKNIVIRGGAIADLLLGLEPNDYDLFYSFEENGQIVHDCRCDDVQKAVNKAKFEYFDASKVDLENSYEKEPYAEPIERTCGFISFHTGFANMFCIDQSGRVWTNRETWQYFQDKIFEVRYEGMLPWAYFPRPGDSKDYYAFLCYELIRAVSYMAKKGFRAGPKMTILFEHAPYLVEKGIERKGASYFTKVCKSKNVNKQTIQKVINRLDIKSSSKENIKKALIKLYW